MKQSVQNFLIGFMLVFTNCTQKTTDSRATNSPSSSSSSSASGSGTSKGTSVTDVTVDQEQLSSLSLADLQTKYKNYFTRNLQDQDDLEINTNIGDSFCQRLSNVRTTCASSNHIIPGGDALNCGLVQKLDDPNSIPFSVLVTDKNGAPLNLADKQFVLIINKTYKSDPFPVGSAKTPIKFVSTAGSAVARLAPEAREIYSMEVRRVDEKTDEISKKGAGDPAPAGLLPDRSNFYIVFSYKNTKLTDGPTVDSDNQAFIGYRYLVNLSGIMADANSSNCNVQQAEIDYIRDSVRNNVQAQQAIRDKNKTITPNLTKDQIIAKILELQASIEQRSTQLEDSRNRLLKLTNEIKPPVLLGCHADEPITSMTISVTGKVEDPKDIGTWNNIPVPGVKGSSSSLSFELGSAIRISIDQSTQAVLGGSWTGKVPDAFVSDIEYLKISKEGIQYDGQRICEGGILGVGTKCFYQCQEKNVFTVTGLTISVDTPSVAAKVIYSNTAINGTTGVIFGSQNYAQEAVMSWSAGNFRANSNWVKFMQDTNCDTKN